MLINVPCIFIGNVFISPYADSTDERDRSFKSD